MWIQKSSTYPIEVYTNTNEKSNYASKVVNLKFNSVDYYNKKGKLIRSVNLKK